MKTKRAKSATSKPSQRAKRPPSNQYGLEDRQWRFCQELIVDDNATQAAIRAGYSQKGAKQTASRLLTNVDLQQAIADMRAARAQRTEISVDLVVQETWAHYQRCVAAEEYGGANKALELLGRHVGAFPNKIVHSGAKGGNIIVEFARAAERTDSDVGAAAR